jgi:alpha-tubulin suppressor-like RCC1 family protein
VNCWGFGGHGQLGNFLPTETVDGPGFVYGFKEGVAALVAGQFFNCAVADGTVYCWGSNYSLELGVADTVVSTGRSDPRAPID